MLVLFVLSLTVLGVTGDYDCTRGGRKCSELLFFSGNSIQEFRESGNILPSDEFFQLNCKSIVDFAKCEIDYLKNCGDDLIRIPINGDAILESLIEFCDEESVLRKGYKDHVACFNRFDARTLENNTCIRAAEYAVGTVFFGATRPETEMTPYCFALHAIGSCLVDLAEDSCGEEAGQLVTNFQNRFKDILYCSKDDEEYIEKFMADLLSSIDEELE